MRHRLTAAAAACLVWSAVAYAQASPRRLSATEPDAGNARSPESLGRSTVPAIPQEATVRLGEMKALVPIQGTVATADLFRLKSTIEGRAEALLPSTGVWIRANVPLGFLVDQELAALIDSKGTTPEEITEERWQRLYRPTRISFPEDCYVLKRYVRNKQRVLPNAFLFEVARTLRLNATVAPENCHWLKDGLFVVAWPKNDPSRTIQTQISRWTDPRAPGAGCAIEAPLSRFTGIQTDSPWEGRVEIPVRKRALTVPTQALLHYQDAVYLPVQVSTGATVGEDTEVTAGVEEKRRVLILKPLARSDDEPHARPAARPTPKSTAAQSKSSRPPGEQSVPVPATSQAPRAYPQTQSSTSTPEPQPEARRQDVEPNPHDMPPGDDEQ